MKRRDFLVSLASAIPAATVLGGVAQAARAARIGVLLPSDAALRGPWLSGWQAAGGQRPSVTAQITGGHTQASEVISQWLESDRVDVIVSVLSAYGSQVSTLLERRGVPMLVTDFGANWQRPSSALVVRQGLGFALGAYALGQHAAATGSRTAVMVLSSFDAGFDHPRAFQLGFENAGGHVFETLLLDSSAVAWDATRLDHLRPDAVYVAASSAASLAALHVPHGVRLLAGGLAPWLLDAPLETALGTDLHPQHPAFTLGLEAAQTMARTAQRTGSGAQMLSALLQVRASNEPRWLAMRSGQMLNQRPLDSIGAGAQHLLASRSSGYSNAYPVL